MGIMYLLLICNKVIGWFKTMTTNIYIQNVKQNKQSLKMGIG